MKWLKLNWKLPAQKKGYSSGKNISRFCLENPLNLQINPFWKINNNQLDIEQRQFTQEQLNVVQKKTWNRNAAGLEEISPEEWKTKKINDFLLRYCNAVYNQNKIEKWTRKVTLKSPRTNEAYFYSR